MFLSQTFRRLRVVSMLMAVLMLSFFASPSIANTLDSLFEELRNATDEMTAREIENRIWSSWFESGDAEIDSLMQKAMQRKRVYDFNGAHALLDEIIELKPDYSEAWNQRATVYFHQGEQERSLEAIARTLELEPRHFGSMAGRIVIRLQQFKHALARQNLIEALKIHPFLKERAFFPDLKQ